MKIAITGEEKRLVEFRKIIAAEHELIESENFNALIDFSSFDLIVDLNADDRFEIADTVFTSGKFVLLCAVKKSLAQMTNRKNISSIIAGINSLPTFLSRPVQEISFLNQDEFSLWKNIFESLNWKTRIVNDRVGMVTPRILFMIINEACFTLEERTASKEDIDSGMKLGTAYPIGPLEWADKIGIENIFETLLGIKKFSNDIRYNSSPLLKSMFLNKQKFYLD
ncbi:MAG: 3-hydroxyacyl-CoA dehydrogenase [Sphingobacteriales bacterium]|nr:MAG: 3-hydroxyacyl-CoA dehydrogenase [Sphingobacteriales bacterium]